MGLISDEEYSFLAAKGRRLGFDAEVFYLRAARGSLETTTSRGWVESQYEKAAKDIRKKIEASL